VCQIRGLNLEKANEIYEKFMRKEMRTGTGKWRYRHNFKLAFDAVYGYRDGNCHEGCRYINMSPGIMEERDCYRCYRCQQIAFRELLIDLSDEEYTRAGYRVHVSENKVKLPSFDRFIRHAYHNFQSIILIAEAAPKSPFKLGLVKKIFYSPPADLFHSDDFERENFHHLVNDIISFSLTEFLLNNDRRYLNCCVRCSNYFIALKKGKGIYFCPECRKKSKWTKEQRRQYQKDYREKRKAEEIKKIREEDIEKRIKLGWTREEAIEMIEADASM